ncbi:MAG TPA: PHP domain-containing protein [Chthoniobacterales bacterium]
MKGTSLLDNAAIAELLAREAEQASGSMRQAFRRAARKAFLWEQEAYDLLAAGKSLTELEGIGPFLAHRIREWFEKTPPLFSPPEIRAGFLTLTRARQVLSENPSFGEALQGDLHAHTCWSDGTGTVAEMAAAARSRGYGYLAITDHTKALKIARGLSEEQLFDQGKEIESVNAVLAEKGIDLVILKSAEVNLSPLGQADLIPSALQGLDLIIGSFHSALRRTEDQTERYLAALRNQTMHILGHPQGRIFDHRVGLRADWARVFSEAAQLDKAVEIDGYPDRQDLKLSLLRLALKEGARISLGTDAHHPWQLRFMEFSLAAAILAGFNPPQIVNFLDADGLRKWVSQISQPR